MKKSTLADLQVIIVVSAVSALSDAHLRIGWVVNCMVEKSQVLVQYCNHNITQKPHQHNEGQRSRKQLFASKHKQTYAGKVFNVFIYGHRMSLAFDVRVYNTAKEQLKW